MGGPRRWQAEIRPPGYQREDRRMFKRTIFSEEHELFRTQVNRFVAAEITPNHAQWEKDGRVSREAWLKAGEAGLLCAAMPEEYGGAGADFTGRRYCRRALHRTQCLCVPLSADPSISSESSIRDGAGRFV